jgi:PAS domain S-box-containing protein
MDREFNTMQASEDFLRTMVDKIPTLAWSCWPDGTTEFLNQRWLEYTGLSMEEALGWGWKTVIHAEDLENLMATWLGQFASGEPGQEEARLRRFDGKYRWFLFRAVPVRDEQGKVIRWYGTNTDIEDLKRAESLLSAEKRTLEMIAGDASLTDVLDHLCRTIDAQAPDTIATVLLMDPDGTRLWPTAGPRVPSGWTQAITPLQIGPCVGSCGTAAFRKEPVITSDIASDPLWAGYQDLALSHGLRASWSQPLISKNDEVLGTFAMYFAEPRSPSDSDLELIKRAGHLAQIAIERKRAEEELQRSEAYLAEAQKLSLTGSFGWNVSRGELFWSKETFCILGYDPGTKPRLELVLNRVHPEDLAYVQQIIDRASRDGIDLDFEHRLLFPDGSIKHVHVIAHAVRDDSGKLEFVGAVSDVTATKLAEEKIRLDERELRRIVDLIPQVVIVTGPDGTPLYANRVMLDYTGIEPDQVPFVGFDSRLSHPEDVEKFRTIRRESVARGIPFQLEQRMLGKDGVFRWFLFRYNPLRDESGKVARWYVTATDIHDRKQTEERVQKENLALREEIDHSSMFEEIVGSSEALRKVLAQVAKVAPVDSTVLILGETGTGKELIARAIHKQSNRSSRAFIRVNCAAIPQSLIASELFGHEKGAFTGAQQRRLGRFELADGGTIFLDEVGDLPAETQVALLRVLQEREFERVGGSQPIAVDVRVLAATNRDLKAAVAVGVFREDLFYRLNVFPIQMPSLRERMDDIHLLVEYFIERYGKTAGKKFRNINKKTLELFQTYDWPGNIRELQNVIERAVILCDGDTFSVDETWLKRESPQTVPFVAALVEREKEIIEAVLAKSRGRIAGPAGAAAKLGIPRQTLESKIKTLGIDKHRFKARLTQH